MSPIPPQCQSIAYEITNLEALRAEVQAQLRGTAGSVKWGLLQESGRLTRQILQKGNALASCVQRGQPGYETVVTVFDLAGNVTLPVTGTLWRIAGPSQTAIETEIATSGKLVFSSADSIFRFSIGLSLHESANPVFTGPLFRSGPRASLPTGSPAGAIDVLVPAPITMTATTLPTLLPAVPFTLPNGTTVTSIIVTLGTGTMTIVLGLTAPAILSITVSFTYSLTFAVVPSSSVTDITEVCLAVPSGPGSVAGGGMLSFLLPSELEIRSRVVPAIQGLLNSALIARAGGAFTSGSLPPGAVVSMRHVTIGPAGIVFFPTVAAFGGVPFP